MLRAGVSLPALMKLLGHRSANMTLRYIEVTQQDLQREFHRAHLNPPHLVPLPPSAFSTDPDIVDAPTVRSRLSGVIRLLDCYRQQNPATNDKSIELLHRRLVRIRSRFEKLTKHTEAGK